MLRRHWYYLLCTLCVPVSWRTNTFVYIVCAKVGEQRQSTSNSIISTTMTTMFVIWFSKIPASLLLTTNTSPYFILILYPTRPLTVDKQLKIQNTPIHLVNISTQSLSTKSVVQCIVVIFKQKILLFACCQ